MDNYSVLPWETILFRMIPFNILKGIITKDYYHAADSGVIVTFSFFFYTIIFYGIKHIGYVTILVSKKPNQLDFLFLLHNFRILLVLGDY